MHTDNNDGDMAQESIVAHVEKNSREAVRVTLSQYRGQPVFSVRTWYRDTHGELRPSPKGITLRIALLPAVAEGIAKALDQIRAAGMA